MQFNCVTGCLSNNNDVCVYSGHSSPEYFCVAGCMAAARSGVHCRFHHPHYHHSPAATPLIPRALTHTTLGQVGQYALVLCARF